MALNRKKKLATQMQTLVHHYALQEIFERKNLTEIEPEEKKVLKKRKKHIDGLRQGIDAHNSKLIDETIQKIDEDLQDEEKDKIFLIARRHTLSHLLKKIPNKKEKSILSRIFDMGKKLFDLLDDIPSVLSTAFKNLGQLLGKYGPLVDHLGAFFLGALAFWVYIYEGVQGWRKFSKTRRGNKDKLSIYKTRLITYGTSIPLSVLGFGICIALIISTALVMGGIGGAGLITLATLLPPFIPGLLLSIYILSLWKRSASLHDLKAKEAEQLNKVGIGTRELAKQLQREIKTLQQEKIALDRDSEEYKNKSAKQREKVEELSTLFSRIKVEEKAYFSAQKRRIIAEGKVALKAIEVCASSLIVLSMLLSALAGLGIITGGVTIPLFILLGCGVSIGFSVKFFEFLDQRSHGALSAWVREKTLGLWQLTKNLFSLVLSSPRPEPATERKPIALRRLQWLGVNSEHSEVASAHPEEELEKQDEKRVSETEEELSTLYSSQHLLPAIGNYL
jgi:hypothetical protein